MVRNLIDRLKQGWGFMRVIRLSLAVLVIIEAYKNSEFLFGAIGGILLFQAVFNYGCCGVSGCEVPQAGHTDQSLQTGTKEMTYEEIK